MSFNIEADAVVEILGVGQCLFFGICVFLARQRNPANIFLAIFMVAFAFSYLDGLLSSFGVPEPFDDVLEPIDYLLPPLIYLYIVDLIAPGLKSGVWRRAAHLLPFGVAVLLLMPYLTLPEALLDASFDLGWLKGGLGDGQGVGLSEPPLRLVAAIIGLELFADLFLVQATAYILAIIVVYWRYRRLIKDIYSNIEAMKLKWLGFITGVFFAIWLIVVPIDFFDSYIADVSDEAELVMVVAQLLALYALGIVGLRQPVVFDTSGMQAAAALSGSMEAGVSSAQGLQPEKHPRKPGGRKYARSALSEEDAERIAGKIEARMTEGRLFMDSMLTLPMLAEQTGVPVNHISQAINQHLGRNFFDFVNGHRIEEAKKLLLTTDDSILDIALAVGFNAKSTFNVAFKKASSDTPSQFRSSGRAGTDGISAGAVKNS